MNTLALSIAGSDPSGGAGIQVDQRVFYAHGWHCATALTAITVQNSQEVLGVYPVPTQHLREQLYALQADFSIGTIKIGMWGSNSNLRCIVEFLRTLTVPVVCDPIWRATAGAELSELSLADELFPHCSLITPNHAEARRLSRGDIASWARDLECAVLVTGGDQDGAEVVDRLHIQGNTIDFVGPRIPGGPIRGTGCTLASAIAAHLGRGQPLMSAVPTAIEYTRQSITHAGTFGAGARMMTHG